MLKSIAIACNTFLFKLPFLLLFAGIYAHSQEVDSLPDTEVAHTFYTTGNLGTARFDEGNKVLEEIAARMEEKEKNATLLLIGNNLPEKSPGGLLEKVKPFAKRTVFIPGATDWESGLKSLKKQEVFLEKSLDNKNVFQPENGCPLVKINVTELVDLLILDSQWALSDWDEIPDINADCDIKNKTAFYEEVESEIIKSQGKTVLIATYHPIATYGRYGHSFALGINSQNINNRHYKEFSERLLTIAQLSENVIFLSGHEKNLQYISEKNIPVIISGAGGHIRRSGMGKNSLFHYNDHGFAKISVMKDGAVWISFYGESNNFKSPLFTSEILEAEVGVPLPDYKEYESPAYVNKSIYEPGELERTGLYKALWGEHYRGDFLTPVKVKTALLDTLYGGLSPLRKGGGHQTSSLRLNSRDGREYTMRSAKKSALRFIQYFIFKTQYLEPEVEDTYFIQLLQDYWTTAYPYGSLTIGDLSDALSIYHANPEVYYVPKQKALGSYNEAYGDKIYFIEERIDSGHFNVPGHTGPARIISTTELLEKLRRKDKIAIDESLYIRTRLFDNIIGDWDRHADQWRWLVQEQPDGIDRYEPIPRDRDQAFSDFDGFMLGAVTFLSPPLRFMQRYDETYNYTRWFNDAGDDVDLAVLINHSRDDWLREAQYIREHLTPEVIDKAFANIPEEMDQHKLARIKKAMLGRVERVEENAVDLYEELRKNVLITGTDKDDWFIITRKPGGITNISGYRIIKGEKGAKFWDSDYNEAVTREIWIYGLNDKDIFEAVGEGTGKIKIKIIGGRDHDTYRMTSPNNIRVFDQKTRENTFETQVKKSLTDNYDLNTYFFKKNRRDIARIIPLLGYDPDNGMGLGASYGYTKNSLWRNPFTQKHDISAVFYTETSGIDILYTGEFANIADKLNFGLTLGYSSPSYTQNFFGLGNETPNFDDQLDFDYNRVRLQRLFMSPSLIYRGHEGGSVSLALRYEGIEIERTPNRFIDSAGLDPRVFESQDFIGTVLQYSYENFDNPSLPKNGIGFGLTLGYTANLNLDRGYGYLIPQFRFTTRIDKAGWLVYATKFQGHLNLGDDYEFYQAASIGDGNGPRGYRQQRFAGKYACYQTSDLRLRIGRIRNAIIPVSFGVYGGFDYGRVWMPLEDSGQWHTSPGGGLYFNLAGLTTANFAYFTTTEGGRVNFTLALAF